MFKRGGGDIIIFRKQAELVHTRTHMCYPEMDNIENVHSKNLLLIRIRKYIM